MGLGSIYWVGDLYQKIESLPVADETVYEDTVKYVEEQMHTFGASVKKLYSEVMQDLLPQSVSSTVTDENHLSSEAHQVDVATEQHCPNKVVESQHAELSIPNPHSASRLDGRHSEKDEVRIADKVTEENGGLVVNVNETTISTSGSVSSDFDDA